jgi:hypothetical protein
MREYRPLRDIIFGVGKREGRGEEGGGGEGKRGKKRKKGNNRGAVSNVTYDPFRAAHIR